MMTDFKALYLLHCANLSDCTTKEDVKRHNAAMNQLGKLFYHIQGEQDKSFLLELLSNKNDRTKALVAAHCLGWTVRKDTIYIKPFQADNKAACERAEKQIRNLTQCSECRYE